MGLIGVLMVLLGWMPLVCFMGALLGGEETVLLLAAFAARDLYPVWIVFVFCFLGVFVADAIWFYIGRLEVISKLKNTKYFKSHSENARDFLDRKVKSNHFTLLMSTKFLYGLRLITIMYLGRRMKFRQFLWYNSIVAAIWTVAIVGLGWFAGQGIGWLWDTYKDIQMIIAIIIGIGIGFYILKIILGRVTAKWAKK